VEELDDIKRGNYIFMDGHGFISEELAREINNKSIHYKFRGKSILPRFYYSL
jgi:hypothetical protein